MKIIRKDAYVREKCDDTLICENVDKPYGNKIVEALNNDPKRYHEDWYKLVPDDYKLYKFNKFNIKGV